MERKLKITRRFAFAIEILVIFVLQGTPRLIPPVFGNTPSLLVCVALTIAIAENEICAMVFGLVCGALTDIGFTNRVGYFAAALAIVCFFVGYFTENIFVTNLLNTMLCSVIVVFVLFSLYFLIFHIWLLRYSNVAYYYTRHYLVRIAYTLIFIPPFYGLNKVIKRKTA